MKTKTAAVGRFGCLWVVLLAILPATHLTADDPADYLVYLQELETLEDRKFTPILIDELNTYAAQFPRASNLDEIHWKLGRLYQSQKQPMGALVAYLKIVYLFAESPHQAGAGDHIRTMLTQNRTFEPLRDHIEDLLNPTLLDSTREAAFYVLMRDLFEYNFPPVSEVLIRACEQFLRDYPDSPRAAEVLFWKAELLARERQYHRALATHMKLTHLHTASFLVTSSKLRMAALFTEELGLHERAVRVLEGFLKAFPEDAQAPLALLQLAKVKEEKLNKPLEALEAYKSVAEKYPESLEAVPALFKAARLYEKQFEEYDQAIRVYMQVVRQFSDDLKAPHAMVEAGRLYEKRYKDYTNAAKAYAMIFERYPDNKLAPDFLFKAAELYEKKLEDADKALELYLQLVDHYPKHDLAEKASKRIEALTKS